MREVRNGFAQNFVGERSSIAFPEEQKAEDVRDGISFLPFEVDVRDTPGAVPNVNEQGGNGVCDHGTPRVQNTVVPDTLALDVKALIELGSVGSFNFEEDDGGMIGKTMKLPYERLDPVQILSGCVLRAAGDNSKRLITGVLNKAAGFR